MKRKSEIIAETIDNLRRVFQVVNEQSKKAKRKTGLTGPQLWAIKMISQNSPIRVSALADKMYLHPATVVGIINRLEERDLVKRIRTTDDRRAVNLTLTERGSEIVRRSPEVAQGMLVAGLEPLTLKELLGIHDGLDMLVEILGAQEIPPQMMLSPEVNIPKDQVQKKPSRVYAKASAAISKGRKIKK